MGRLWAFSGLDGAGKSTQIELLLAELNARRARVRRVWARGGYTPLFDLLKALARRLNRRSLPAPGRSAERTKKFGSPGVRRTWLAVAMLDLFLYYGIWVRGLRWAGFTVVADRWVEDTALDFRLNFPEEDTDGWLLWRALRRVMPTPDVHFVFVIPVAESLRRSVLKNEPFPDDRKVLTRRLNYYEDLVRTRPLRRVDGTQPRAVVGQNVLEACKLR